MNATSDQRDIASPADGSSAKRRRAAVQHVREARDRLISTTGTRPAFDTELDRLRDDVAILAFGPTPQPKETDG